MATEPSYKRRLPAGIVDSSFASMATFIVGLAAVNLFDDVNRGVYAVYFTAFLTGQVLARNLVFTPAEVKAVSFDTGHRLVTLSRSLLLGIAPGFVGALTSIIAYWVTSSYADPDVAYALTVTVAVSIVLSPMQDHVRRMLHIAAHSWMAASVSIVQLAVVLVTVGAAIATDFPIEWIPFGALAVANLVSLVFAWLIGRRAARGAAPERLTMRELAEKGKWLVAHASVASATGFAMAAIIAELADPETLGYAESARVVAQPVIVLAFGLSAVLAPRSMRAAMDTDAGKARQTNRVYMAVLALAGVAYIAVAGWDWTLNPMAYIVPSAYVVSGLIAVQVIANLGASALFLQVNEMLGAHKERTLFYISALVSPITLAGASTAGVTGAFARPIAMIMSTSTKYTIQHQVLKGAYAAGPRPHEPGEFDVEDTDLPSPSVDRP